MIYKLNFAMKADTAQKSSPGLSRIELLLSVTLVCTSAMQVLINAH